MPTPSAPGLYIAVCGPIGVGKSTLARYLAQDLGAAFSAERFDAASNPFLARFYREKDKVGEESIRSGEAPTWALATELSFLCQRVDMVRDISAMLSAKSVVADWAAAQNIVFSRLTLAPAEFDLYQLLYDRLMEGSRAPDLIVCLDADLGTLKSRISERGRPMETAIGSGYLASVRSGYSQWKYNPPGPSLLWVDTTALNIHAAADRRQVVTQVRAHLETSALAAAGELSLDLDG